MNVHKAGVLSRSTLAQPGWGLRMQHAPQASVKVTERTEPGSLTSFNLQVFLQKAMNSTSSPIVSKEGGREEREAPASCPGECFLTVSLK